MRFDGNKKMEKKTFREIEDQVKRIKNDKN